MMNWYSCFYVSVSMMSVFMVVLSWLSVYYFRQQLLVSLLSLEVVTLGIFLFLACLLSQMGLSISVSFYILVMGACEAALGLSLLVLMTRLKGSDMYLTLSMLSC